jgi:polysaccharide biosynthesis transport protein
VHQPEGSQSSLGDYLKLIARHKILIVLAVFASAGSALTLSALKTPVYQASADVVLQPRSTESLFGSNVVQDKAVRTEVRVITSEAVAKGVADRIGSAPGVSANPIPETNMFQVSARSVDPEQAALIANTYVAVYIETVREQAVRDLTDAASQAQRKVDELQGEIDAANAELADLPASRRGVATKERDSLLAQQGVYQQRLEQLQIDVPLRTGGAQLVNSASPPGKPISPTPVRNGVLGAALGLALGLGMAFLLENLDETIKNREQATRATSGLPVVGSIPVVTSWRKRTETYVVCRDEPTSPAAESYRGLRTAIHFLNVDRTLKTLQVTSAAAGDGKTTTVANLAYVMSGAGQRVIVVACDLRRPRVHEFFGLRNDVGFTNVLMGDVPLSKALQTVERQSGLQVLSSGMLPPNPAELLASPRAAELLATLQRQCDTLLLDCPPVLPVTDAVVLSSHVDASLLVMTAGKTSRREAHRATEMLRQVEAPLIGTVLNGAREDEEYGSYAFRYYKDERTLPIGVRSRREPVASSG